MNEEIKQDIEKMKAAIEQLKASGASRIKIIRIKQQNFPIFRPIRQWS